MIDLATDPGPLTVERRAIVEEEILLLAEDRIARDQIEDLRRRRVAIDGRVREIRLRVMEIDTEIGDLESLRRSLGIRGRNNQRRRATDANVARH